MAIPQVPKIWPVTNFVGGVRNDKSNLEKDRNELVSVRNFDLSDRGLAKKRLGSHQVGDTPSSADIISSVDYFDVGGGTDIFRTMVATAESTTAIYEVVGTRLTSAVATTDTTINADDTTDFDASGDIEIDGDEITYTGKTGTTFTGCSGISEAHDSGTAVHQMDNVPMFGGSTIDGRAGIYFASLGSDLYMNGRSGNADAIAKLSDTPNWVALSSDDSNGVFLTTYRDRLYNAGNGTSVARNTVNYSNAGDGDTWDVVNQAFQVTTTTDNEITGLFASTSDELIIWMKNAFFTYNEVTLKLRSSNVGAYAHRVVQEIDGLIYTFCPSGVFRTNGRKVERISEPIGDYIKDFRPVREGSATDNRIVTNTFATVFDKKYILYIGDIESVGSVTDVLLVFDTVTDRWSVWDGPTDLIHLRGTTIFQYGGGRQEIEGLFAGDTAGGYFRFFSKSYRDADGNNRFTTTGDLFDDMRADGSRNIVKGELVTPYYDLDTPSVNKQFQYLRVLSETGDFSISYRTESPLGRNDWKSLGAVSKPNERLRFPRDAFGYRIQIRVSHADTNSAPVLNGLVFEETTVKEIT